LVYGGLAMAVEVRKKKDKRIDAVIVLRAPGGA
jgi:hypothetical protein